jgi:class 3 adenylate cyclase
MSFWTDLRLPCEQDLLIGFYDLKGFTHFLETTEPIPVLETMSGYFSLTGRIIAGAGGRLIKTRGDAGLVAFPAALADTGVRTLQEVQTQGGEWLAARGWRSRPIVKLHLGPVAIGRVGSPGEEIIDVHGKTVNVAASLPRTGFAMSPAVFRSLDVTTRQLFKKHTPPITYIGLDDSRPA